MNKAKSGEGGYAAIMTTIVISLVLLGILTEQGFSGWHARFFVLNREKKYQANALADGCIDFALGSIMKDPALTSIPFELDTGTCDIEIIDASDPRAVEINLQSRVGTAETGVAFTNMKIVADSNSGKIISREETP